MRVVPKEGRLLTVLAVPVILAVVIGIGLWLFKSRQTSMQQRWFESIGFSYPIQVVGHRSSRDSEDEFDVWIDQHLDPSQVAAGLQPPSGSTWQTLDWAKQRQENEAVFGPDRQPVTVGLIRPGQDSNPSCSGQVQQLLSSDAGAPTKLTIIVNNC